MLVRTYLKQHPDVKEFWLMSGTAFSLCRTDDFDDINNFGDRKITRVEEVEGEPVTLHIR